MTLIAGVAIAAGRRAGAESGDGIGRDDRDGDEITRAIRVAFDTAIRRRSRDAQSLSFSRRVRAEISADDDRG